MTWDTPKSETHVTVAGLIERQVSLRWHEAVAIVLEVADVFQRSRISSVPPRDALSLIPSGTIEFEGDAAPTADPVTALADTLAALLPLLPKDPPTQLQLIASTAGPNSVSYKSVDEFSEALGYFERPGRRRILSDVYSRALDVRSERWSEPHAGADTVPASSDAPTRMLPTRDIVSQETVETGDMRQLVESVRQFGVLQPLLVRQFGSGYELVAGAKRFAAAKVAGLTEVPCRIADDVVPAARSVPSGPRSMPEEESRSGGAREASRLKNLDGVGGGVAHVRDPAPMTDLVLGPALGEIADSLRAATSCWRLSVEGPDRPYSRTVNEVTRAELQRATWVVEALQLLTQRPVVTKARVNVGTVLEQVFRATEPERRLADVSLSANLAEGAAIVRGDERLLTMAVGGVIQALVALLSEVAPATILCSAASREGAVAVVLSQNSVVVPPSLIERFFDETCHGRPGGYGTAIALAAANRVFELHGGRTQVDSDERGCRVTLTLPV